MGVALALPWMESLPLLGQTAAAVKANTPPLRLGIVFFSNGVEPIHWWAKGQRREHGARAGPAADDAASRGHGVPPGALQPDGGRLDQPAPRPHERAVGRAGQSRSERDPRRHVDGPDPRLADRRTHRDSEPRARHRAERAAARGRPVDDLRLERVVDLADQAGDQGDLSRRGRSIAWSATARGRTARSQHPRRGAAGLTEPQAEDQPGRQREAERVPRIDPRHREAHRAGVEGRAHRRLAADAGAARHAAPGERAAAERPGSHEADARSDRARVPDGQDARRDADAQQRPVADELQVPGRRAGRAASRPHAQRARRGQGSDVPEDQPVPHRAVRLPHAAHEGDLRGGDARSSTTRS